MWNLLFLDLGHSLQSTLLPSGTEVQTCVDNCQKVNLSSDVAVVEQDKNILKYFHLW